MTRALKQHSLPELKLVLLYEALTSTKEGINKFTTSLITVLFFFPVVAIQLKIYVNCIMLLMLREVMECRTAVFLK